MTDEERLMIIWSLICGSDEDRRLFAESLNDPMRLAIQDAAWKEKENQ